MRTPESEVVDLSVFREVKAAQKAQQELEKYLEESDLFDPSSFKTKAFSKRK